MSVRSPFVAVAALLLPVGAADAGLTTVEIGTFQNTGLGEIDYQGGYGEFVNAIVAGDSTRIDLDVAAILETFGDGMALAGIRVIDTGLNQYGVNSAGADIDLMAFTGLPNGIELDFSYAGPNGNHVHESSGILQTRVAFIDHESGVHEWQDTLHVSLGDLGALTAMLSSPVDLHDVTSPPLAGAGFGLSLAEAGVGESFHLEFLMSLPTPGAIPLLGLALLAGRSRRRRPSTPAA